MAVGPGKAPDWSICRDQRSCFVAWLSNADVGVFMASEQVMAIAQIGRHCVSRPILRCVCLICEREEENSNRLATV